jgi:FMN reductase
MTRLVGVLGSVTPPGRLRTALAFALSTGSADSNVVETELIDLADYHIDLADGRPLEQTSADTRRVVQTIGAADAVLFASPVYRASYTGVLKNLLDLLPVESLQGKPCGIVAMGATPHHYLGVDWHLRDVLTWFGAMAVPTSVYLASPDFAEGQPVEKARQELQALVASVLLYQARLGGVQAALGPTPLAAQRR